jgi:hypothetical protein
MNKFENVQSILQDRDLFISTVNIQKAKDELYDFIYSNERGVYLFSGEAGGGKSLIVDRLILTINSDIYLYRDTDSDERAILAGLYRLIKKKSLASNIAINEVKKRVNDAYKKVNHTIIIDNADRLDDKVLESLSTFFKDNRDLKVIFVVDITSSTRDSDFFNSIIKTDEKNIVTLENYSEDEIVHYYEQLLKFSFFNSDLKQIKRCKSVITELTGGNLKKMRILIGNLFEIVHYAEESKLKKLSKIDNCTLTMSAIKGGLVDG